MLSQAFFYFVGQNITWLLSSWVKSLSVCAVICVVVLLVNLDYAAHGLTTLVGWASVVVVPEFILKITHVTFDTHIKYQLLPILVLLDVFIFVCITIVVNVNDSSPAVWILLMAAHFAYVWIIWHVNNFSKRVQDVRIYFATYLLTLVANDAYFLIVALIVHGHPLNFISVAIAGVLTAVPLLFASSEAFAQWVEKHTTAPAARVPSDDLVE